ncbi:hypothetical protein RB595_006666 [Gaeumannomyces hyphopodioides]
MASAAATILPLRPAARCSSRLLRHKPTATPTVLAPHRAQQPRARSFFNLSGGITPAARPAHLTASRRLPYPAEALYDIIADVDAYASFLPYCQRSRVTHWRDSAAPGGGLRRSPAAGDLTVGWGPVTESYTSRLYCLPGRVVEAVSGKGAPSIPRPHAGDDGVDVHGRPLPRPTDGGLFESLVTRWAVTPSPAPSRSSSSSSSNSDWADVELSIRYQFANPMYQLATGSVADEVAGLMVNAFEKRARDLLGSRARATPPSRMV